MACHHFRTSVPRRIQLKGCDGNQPFLPHEHRWELPSKEIPSPRIVDPKYFLEYTAAAKRA